MKENSELEQLKKIAELSPIGIGLFDLTTSAPVFLNQAYYNLVGYTREEYQTFIHDNERLMFPDDLKISYQSQYEYAQAGEANNYEYRIVRKDGRILWIKLNVATTAIDGKQYAYASFIDITREKETYSQLALIAENSSSSISLLKITNGNEELVYANEQFFDLIGIDRASYESSMVSLDEKIVSAFATTGSDRLWQKQFRRVSPEKLSIRLSDLTEHIYG